MGEDLDGVYGSEQLAGVLEEVIENSLDAINDVFNEKSSQGQSLMLLDAANAFNSVNLEAALLNAGREWPRGSTFFFNSYQSPSELFFQGSNESLFSYEGTTQGDPLSILLYGMALMPMIRRLRNPSHYI